ISLSAGSMIARASSGSRSCSSSVEPLISANSAVTVLRSPSSCAPLATVETRTRDFKVSLVSTGGGSIGFEHSRQNFARGGFSLPHELHRRANRDAHSIQNLAPSGFSAPHFEQRIDPYRLLRTTRSCITSARLRTSP